MPSPNHADAITGRDALSRSQAGPLAAIDVFAVEDDAVQLTWSSLPAPELALEVAGRSFLVGAEPPPWYRVTGGRPLEAGRAGPGAVTVGGLDPATTYDVCLSGSRLPRRRVAVARTLPAPPGRLLARFATVSDTHIGERRLGFLGVLHDPRPRPPGLVPYPERCLTVAVHEAKAWGAELIVAKGDLTQRASPGELYRVAELLLGAGLPVEAVLGNHDLWSSVDAAAVLGGAGVPAGAEPRAVDLPGVRVVMGHSPVPGRHSGAVDSGDAAALAELVGAAPGGAVVAMHHPPQRFPLETKYPPSIGGRDSHRLVRALARANPSTCIVAGHTHRNRRYRLGGLTVAEVGSTKDYPGQWAGYAVYEGGIRQAVFRVAAPEAMAWTEGTKRALGGLWGWWSPGRLADRSWTLTWPNQVVTP